MLGCVCAFVCMHCICFGAFFVNQYVLYTYINCYVSTMNKYCTVQKFSGRKFWWIEYNLSKLFPSKFWKYYIESSTQFIKNLATHNSLQLFNLSKILFVKLLCRTVLCYWIVLCIAKHWSWPLYLLCIKRNILIVSYLILGL